MAINLKFLSWKRSRLYRLAHGDGDEVSRGGRLIGRLELEMSEHQGERQVDARQAPIPFEIMGPRDLEGMREQAVREVSPPPDSQGNEITVCPYVVFASPDFPWRYSPRLARRLDGVLVTAK